MQEHHTGRQLLDYGQSGGDCGAKARDNNGIMYSLATDLKLKFLNRCSDKWRVLNLYFKHFQYCLEVRKIRMEEKKLY